MFLSYHFNNLYKTLIILIIAKTHKCILHKICIIHYFCTNHIICNISKFYFLITIIEKCCCIQDNFDLTPLFGY